MLIDVDIAYLFTDEDKEQGMGSHADEKPANLDVFKKSITQQFTFFYNEAVSGAQRVLSCLDTEAEAFVESMDYTQHSSELSPLVQLGEEELEEHRLVVLDSYKDLLAEYQAFYVQVQDLHDDYERKKKASNASKLISTVKSSLGYEALDRKSQIDFIQSLLPQVMDPLAENEQVFSVKSFQWLHENVKEIQKGHLVLEGICLYVYHSIQKEYSEKKPSTVLFELLSNTVDNLSDVEKVTALNFLLEQAKSNEIKLLDALLKMRKSQGGTDDKNEAFKAFKRQCKRFLKDYRVELLDDSDSEIEIIEGSDTDDDDALETASNLSM